MLPAWLCWRLRIWMQQKITAARMSAAPMIDPTTMPAIAPPERPARPLAGEEEGDDDGDSVGNTGGMETVVGRSTSVQRVSAFALTQQESVSFNVLPLQKAHSPIKLFSNPHSLGSLLDASMQRPLRASVGFEHRVKSDLI